MENIENILGTITCKEVRENEDGSATIIFDVTDEFKENYMKMFNLTEWSLEHFEGTLSEAIENAVKLHKEQKGE